MANSPTPGQRADARHMLNLLIEVGRRLAAHNSEAGLRKAIVADARTLLGAQRVLLVLQADDGPPEIAGASLPRKEEASQSRHN